KPNNTRRHAAPGTAGRRRSVRRKGLERLAESVEKPGSRRVRCDPYRSGFAGDDPVLVFRRSEKAGNHQLPYLQAGARRSVLRQDLRPGEGLRVPVRKVQAPQRSEEHTSELQSREKLVCRLL